MTAGLARALVGAVLAISVVGCDGQRPGDDPTLAETQAQTACTQTCSGVACGQPDGCGGTCCGPTVFTSADAPASFSSGTYELGMKFTSDTSTQVSRLRFYKTPSASGSHVAHLWSSAGALLATAPFTAETASGWQEVTLATPIAITAGTTYVVSYSSTGQFALTLDYFTTGKDVPPLHVPAHGGVYNSPGSFPTLSYSDSNYWVDLVTSGTTCTPACSGVACGQSDGCGGTCCTGSGCTAASCGTCQIATACGSCGPAADNTACTTGGGGAGTCQAGSCSATGTTNPSVFSSQDAPATSSVGSFELGMEFTSDTSTQVTHVRFYKTASASGSHVAHVWSSTGALLATQPFTAETASGWQDVTLTTPVAITAGTTYVVSYSSTGQFALTLDYFTTAKNVPPLHVPAHGGIYSSPGSFPTLSYSDSNYWVDIVTSGAAPNPSVFTSLDAPATSSVGSFELGMEFTSDITTHVTHVRFYKTSSASGSHVAHVWSSTGVLLATAPFTAETASGWQDVTLTTPVAITAGTTYVVSYSSTGRFALTLNYFTTGKDVPPLHVPAHGGVYNSPGNFPTLSYSDSNYWVDLVTSGTTCTPACSGVACGQSDGCGGTCCTGSGCTAASCGTCQIATACGSCGSAADNTACTTGAGGAGTCQAGSCSATGTSNPSVFSSQDAPANSSVGSFELGMEFTSDTSTQVTHVRFYKTASASGSHVAHLWSSTGALLATEPFTAETASGWQDVTLTTPVAITAGTTYVVSYSSTGRFALTLNYFTTGKNVPPLHVPAHGGVYNSPGSFPTLSYSDSNYWVDIVTNGTTCTPACSGVACGQSDGCGGTCCTGSGCTAASCGTCQIATACGSCGPAADNTACTTSGGGAGTCQAGTCSATGTSNPSVFTSQDAPTGSSSGMYELGMKFTSDNATQVSRLRFYKAASSSGSHVGHLWSATGTLLATAPFTAETASGWQEVILANPVGITAGTTYVVSYSSTGGYAVALRYFTTSKDVPPLHVPAHGGVYASSGNFPTLSYLDSNYWVDIVTSDASCTQCDDGNPCTTDTCDPEFGCVHGPASNGTSCTDGNACTQTDVCQAGVCVGSNPVGCSASDQCHAAGTCDPSSGVCSNPLRADGAACNDGNACTQTDSCQSGVCSGANPVLCNASDQCHAAGSCDPATGACSNPAVVDGAACNDGSACTQTDTCQNGVCNGANPVICLASDQCHAGGVCNPANGQCSNPPRPEGSACNDGNACTQTDTCQSGTCSGANPVTCSAQSAVTAASMQTARAYHSASRLPDGRVIVAGGVGSSGSILGSVEIFSAGSWSAGPALSVPREHARATELADGRVLVSGGYSPIGSTAVAEIYDPIQNAWTSSIMILDRYSHSATTLNDGRVLVCGGINSAIDRVASCEVFNPKTDVWTSVASMSTPRQSPAMTVLGDGRVLVVAGYNTDYLDSAELYDPTTDVWTPAASLPDQRYGASMVTLADGSALLVGGVSHFGSLANYYYSPSANEWTSAGSLSSPRDYETDSIFKLPGGRFIAAGNKGSPTSTIADVFDPATGLWTPIGAQGAVVDPACAPLIGGDLLVTGGVRDQAFSSPVVTRVSLGSGCQTFACNPQSGTCDPTNLTNGTSCDDANPCTKIDSCQAGACVGAQPVDCGSGDQCHDSGSCSVISGSCLIPTKADGTACTDSDACTQGETCLAGVCGNGLATVCSASDQCHGAGACDPATGACSQPLVADGTPCNDANECTLSDSCQTGACTGANPVSCQPTDMCHVAGTCDPSNGSCSNPTLPGSCDDGDPCTDDSCDPATGCAHTPAADGTACTTAGGDPGTCSSGICQ